MEDIPEIDGELIQLNTDIIKEIDEKVNPVVASSRQLLGCITGVTEWRISR
jgi:hypothetical protein